MTSTSTPTRVFSFEANDYLGIELEAREGIPRFLIRPRSLTPLAEKAIPGSGRYSVRGEELFDYVLPSSMDATMFCRELPESNWDKKRERFVVPALDTTVMMVLKSWRTDRIIFVNDEAKTLFYKLLETFSVGEAVARQAALFKNEGAVPALPASWQELKAMPLSPYQRTAVKLSLDVPAFALWMDRGTGKTACAIQRVNMLAKMLDGGEIDGGVATRKGRMLRVLIIVPKNVRLNWQREFAKFSHLPGKVTVLRGGLAKRIHRIAEACRPDENYKFSVLIASYDGVRTTADYLSMMTWDDVITDEAHYYKDPSTERFKGLVKIRDLASRRRCSLTGTPIGNSPMDLWSQLEFLRQGGSGFSTHKAFKEFHGVWKAMSRESGAQGIQKLVGLQNIPFLQERLARMTFSVTKEEAGLNLPDKVYSVNEVQMTAYQADVYNRLQDELALEVEDKLSGEVVDEVTVSNILTMLLRLAQVTSGFITYNAKYDPDTKTCIIPARREELSPENPKVQELLSLLQDEDRDPRAKTIVWCHFIHNIERVSQALTEAGIVHGCYYGGTASDERDRLVDQFNNNPEFKVLVCNPQTAGEGLNLLGYNLSDPKNSDTYCDMEVFFSSGWSAILRAQAEDRAHRRGTRMPLQIIDLVVPGTIDEEILERVTEKRQMAETVSDLKGTLSRLLKGRVEAD